MLRLTPRAGRWPLAFALAALGACADEPSPTAPGAQPRPNLAVGDIITVTTAADGPDLAGSLRWAVRQAVGGETIRFASDLAGATITLDSVLAIFEPVTIEGPADKGITISAAGRGRAIAVNTYDGSTAPSTTLRNLSITGGKISVGQGAGIFTVSPLVLEHVTVWGNEAGGGAAIAQASGNLAFGLTLINSTVSGNVGTGTLWPAITTTADLTLINSTVAYNSPGAIWTAASGTMRVRNSILAHNGPGKNCDIGTSMVSFEGKNLSDDMTCGDAAVTIVGDPKLGPLAMNGGPTMTHALLPTSPAMNAGKDCTVTVDQRYRSRDAQCDIGAFEFTDPTAVTITIDPSATVDVVSGDARVTGTVKCSRNGDQFGVRVDLQQQKSDNAPSPVRGAGVASVACTTSAQPWSALVVPAAGAFKAGAAAATAATHQAPSWVTPSTTSRSITLHRPRN